MITQVDDKNREKYQALYAKANNALGIRSINSLESYFTHIQELLGKSRQYTILPIQEEYFEIDANARTITVPENFRKNGLSVAGDNTAETIYFKINRYFDAMDLNNTDIYIQWENSAGESGFSKEWVRDIDTFEDYLIFGWVLGDRITKQPGTLKFSIRFIVTKQGPTADEKVVTYSLSTLTAQALINPGLDFDINTKTYSDDLNSILATNFRNTTTTIDNEIKVFKFIQDFDELVETANAIKKDNDIISADLDAEGNLIFSLSAYADIGVSTTYYLYKMVGSDIDYMHDPKVIMEDIEYKVTADTVSVADKDYYILDSDGNYVKYPFKASGIIITEPKTYFEKYNKYTLSKDHKVEGQAVTGTYYGSAIVQTSDKSESSPKFTQYKVVLEPPEKAELETPLINSGYEVNFQTMRIHANIAENNKATYTWYRKLYNETEFSKIIENSESNEYMPTEEGTYRGEITTSRNTDSITIPEDEQPIFYVTALPTQDEIIITNPTSDVGMEKGNSFTIKATYTPPHLIPGVNYGLSYEWQKQLEDDPENYVAIKGATEARYTFNEPGVYRCAVRATYNDLTISKNTAKITVE